MNVETHIRSNWNGLVSFHINIGKMYFEIFCGIIWRVLRNFLAFMYVRTLYNKKKQICYAYKIFVQEIYGKRLLFFPTRAFQLLKLELKLTANGYNNSSVLLKEKLS